MFAQYIDLVSGFIGRLMISDKSFYPPPPTVTEVEGEVCTLCTDVMGVVRYLLTDPTLETMIKSYAETACSVTGPLAPLVGVLPGYLQLPLHS
jgi:hypothetical protein